MNPQIRPGARFRLLREAQYPRVSQAKAAALFGTTRNIIANIEAEPPRGNPNEELLRKASAAWGKPYEWFLSDGELPSFDEIIARPVEPEISVTSGRRKITITIEWD